MDRLWMDEEEVWKTFFDVNESEDDSLLANCVRLFSKQVYRWKKKKKKIDEEELEAYYNVAVYQVLPYPPKTKDVNDSYVQRT